MPELLDLPPELIEQIFAFTKEYVRTPWCKDEPASQFIAPVSRLTCRYIEGATRRLFIDRFFDTWHIKAADDQIIQKFCKIVNTSDLLIRGLRALAIYADDDQMIARRQEDLQEDHDILQDDEVTHFDDPETGAMVPVAYFQNQDKIIQAFRACRRLQGLHIYPSSDREKLQRALSGDRDQHGQSMEPAELFWLDDERRFDVGTSLNYFLSLAHAAGVRIRHISTDPSVLSTSNCVGLVKYKSALQEMQELLLTIGYGLDEETYDVATRIGNQLLEGLTSMPILRKLVLSTEEPDEQESFAIWSTLSRCPAIPTLEELAIYDFAMIIHDFTNFILKHKSTLRKFQIDGIKWIDGAPSTLGWFYGKLSKAPQLEEVEQLSWFFTADPDGELGIPKHLLKP